MNIDENLQKKIEEAKRKVTELNDDELDKASGGAAPKTMGIYDKCDSFFQSPVVKGKCPAECRYCIFAIPKPCTNSMYCYKDIIPM